MTFPYVLGVPTPPHDPSEDVTAMQSNTNTIGDWVEIDHVGFNSSTGGTHLQVTFSSNNVPSVPTTPPVLFTNNDAFSVPQLFYYTGTASQSSGQYNVVNVNGSTMLLGGIILKWGLVVPGNPNPVAFTTPFPHACVSVVCTSYGASTPVGTTGTVNINGFQYTGNNQFYWIAIGY